MTRSYSYAIYLLLLIPILLFAALGILGFDGLYGQDAYEYLRYTKRLVQFFQGGEFPGNLVWPKGYLMLSALFSFALPSSVAGQLVSLAAFYYSFYYLYRFLQLYYSDAKYGLPYLILAFLLSPYLLRLSNVMMADSLAIFCLTATAYSVYAFAKFRYFKSAFFAVLFASFGAFSRFALIIPLMPLVVYFCWIVFNHRKWTSLFSIPIPLLFFLLHQFFEGNGSDFLNHYFVEQWSFTHFFQSDFEAATDLRSPTVYYLLPNIVYVFLGFLHPGFCFALALVFILALKQKFKQNIPIILLSSLLLYSLFLAGISFQSSRYLSLTYPLLLLLLFPFAAKFIEQLGKWKKPIFLLSIIIQIVLSAYAMQPSYQLNKMERYLTAELKTFEGNTLYSFEVDVALNQRGLNFEYQNLWEQEYVEFEKGALVLFNENRYAKRYQDKNVMKNWRTLNEGYHLSLEKELEYGWKLYRIHE